MVNRSMGEIISTLRKEKDMTQKKLPDMILADKIIRLRKKNGWS